MTDTPVVYMTEENYSTLQELPEGTKIRAYKFLYKDYKSPCARWYDKEPKTYTVGSVVEESDYSTDRMQKCAEGLHVGTKEFVYYESNSFFFIYTYVEVEFLVEDIVCIPDFENANKAEIEKLRSTGNYLNNESLQMYEYILKKEKHKIRVKRLSVVREVSHEELSK